MKKQITLIGLFGALIAAATPLAQAQTAEQFAAMEQRVATLELQNRSLLAAVEKLAGTSLRELLTDTAAPVAPAPAVPPVTMPARKDTSHLDAALKALQPQIAAAEAELAEFDKALKPDPFSGNKGVRMSKADAAKARAVKETALARLKAQEATLRSQILAP